MLVQAPLLLGEDRKEVIRTAFVSFISFISRTNPWQFGPWAFHFHYLNQVLLYKISTGHSGCYYYTRRMSSLLFSIFHVILSFFPSFLPFFWHHPRRSKVWKRFPRYFHKTAFLLSYFLISLCRWLSITFVFVWFLWCRIIIRYTETFGHRQSGLLPARRLLGESLVVVCLSMM